MATIKRPVFFSGENPGMTLYAPGTERAIAVASYWHCTDSPWGIGQALVFWSDTFPGGIFTDNVDLAQVLVQRLTRHFPEFQEVPIDDLAYITAHCQHTFDGTSYRVICQASKTLLEMEWAEILDRKQVTWPGFPAGEAAYDLTTIICPCRVGRVQINNTPIEGDIYLSQTADGHTSGSAFLAFAESWIGPIEKP
jgi:hypothetical protein